MNLVKVYCFSILGILLANSLNAQSIWEFQGISHSSVAGVNGVTIDSLKSIILNESSEPYLYEAAAENLYYFHRDTEKEFLLANLNTKIYKTDVPLTQWKFWAKIYVDTYFKGLLDDISAVEKMDSLARHCPDGIARFYAVNTMAYAENYDYYDFVKEGYFGESKLLFKSLFARYGRDSRYRDEVIEELEKDIDSALGWNEKIKNTVSLLAIDEQTMIDKLGELFRVEQGEARLNYFIQLGLQDPENQFNRSRYALLNELDDNFRVNYIPYLWRIRDYRLPGYIEPEFIKFVIDLDLSEGSQTADYRKYFLERYEPLVPDSTTPPTGMIDSLKSYNDQCNTFGWIPDPAIYSEISTILNQIEADIINENWFNAYKGTSDFLTYVEDAYSLGNITEDAFKFLWHYGSYLEEVLDPLAPDLPPGPEIVSISPTVTITKTKEFIITVHGSNFSKQTDVYWKGKKKKTKLIEENVLEAKIKKKDIKKEGTYIVTVGNKKSSQSEGVEFNVYKELPGKLIPVLNCVEELDEKKNLAWFGYENYNDGIVLLDGKENEIKGEKKKSGEPPVIFLPGIHEKVFSVEFDDKKKLKWELGKEKAEVKKDSPLCE